MSAPGLTTPLRTETFQKLQLNAGIVLKNLTLDSISTSADLKTAIASAIQAGTTILGATRGGGQFVVTRDMREPEVDGKRYSFVGGTFVDSVDAHLSVTLLEITPANMKDLLGSGRVTPGSGKTVITMNTAISDSDYLQNIVWVGDLADGGYVAIVLENALNTSDFTLSFTDKGEGTLAADFHAHQSDVSDYDTAPFQIVHFDGPAG